MLLMKINFSTLLAGGNEFGHTTQDQVRKDDIFNAFAKMLEVRNKA